MGTADARGDATPADAATDDGPVDVVQDRPTNDPEASADAAPETAADTSAESSSADARDAGVDLHAPVDVGPSPDSGPPVFKAWPGSSAVSVIDEKDVFGPDVSGLVYQAGATRAEDVVWAVDNGTSLLFMLGWNAGLLQAREAGGWKNGKALVYPGGTGSIDAEGLAMAEASENALYVSAERSNDAKSTSRLSVLRFDVSGNGSSLTATHEWNLTADLPASDPNRGLEGVSWIPDSYLVAHGFLDESTGQPYAPRSDDGHGTGLFFVALESNGLIYAYALDHTKSTYRRIASIGSGQPTLVDLTFDRDVGALWAYCDDACANRSTLLGIDENPASPTRGRFVVRAAFEPPAGLPSSGNEGIAIAPESTCVQGKKAFLWSDDANYEGHVFRRGDIPCGALY